MSLTLPFALRRPWLLTRELLQSRARPDVGRLQAIADPEAFVWNILPHAARTFAASITLLPADSARATAIAYLYCRILDTYEDLLPTPAARDAALAAFAARFAAANGDPPAPAPEIDPGYAHDLRDHTHVVLVNRCHLLDAVFGILTPAARRSIVDLVQSMAAGMIWSNRAFAEQRGALRDAAQLSRYCRNVIGLPFLFAVRLLHERHYGDATVADALREDCMLAGEMVQLANVTRDIEKDLRRGIAYHPALAEDVGRTDLDEPELRERIRAVREELLLRALELGPAYARMMRALPFRRFSLARASGMLMLLFTDRYYRACAARVGHAPWRGPRWTFTLMVMTFHHFGSAAASERTLRRVTARFARFVEGRVSAARAAERAAPSASGPLAATG